MASLTLRAQPPVRSPLPGRAPWDALLHALRIRRDPRKRLSDLLRERYHADDVSLCGSGTHALQLALEAARRGRPGVPILLPAYTCYEVATAAVGADVEVALYDVDPDTLAPDIASVRAFAAEGAAAIVVAPLFGCPIDWDEMRELADDAGALLIEDAAQAHGARWKDRPVGSFGDFSVLSFGRGKGWTGMGGGALLQRGGAPALPGRPRQLGQPGLTAEVRVAAGAAAQWLLGRPSLYGLPAAIPFLHLGKTIYHDPTTPRSMTRASAALLLASDRVATAEAEQRRAAAAQYRASFADLPEASASPDRIDGALRFPVRISGGWASLKDTAGPALGVAPGYPTSLGALAALRSRLIPTQSPTPGAETLARELVTLPTHSSTRTSERVAAWRLCNGHPVGSTMLAR